MFLCICNAYRTEDVRLAGLANGTASVEEVYTSLGGPPRCGRCLPHAREMLEQTRAAAQEPNPQPCRAMEAAHAGE